MKLKGDSDSKKNIIPPDGSSSNLPVQDISNPANVIQTGYHPIGETVYSLTVSGGIVYGGGWNIVILVDPLNIDGFKTVRLGGGRV